MKSKIRLALIIIFSIILTISIIGIARQFYFHEKARASRDSAADLVSLPRFDTTVETTAEPEITAAEITEPPTTEPETTAAPETTAKPETTLPVTEPPETTSAPETTPPDNTAEALRGVELGKLVEANSDVIGWIEIPGTTVSYPLLQGDDNTHYLDYAWDGSKNPGGSIYLDYRSNTDFSDFHSIIYGHRMYRDAMFNSLKNYSDPKFLIEHPSVYIVTEDTVRRYDIFAAYDADAINGHSYRLGLKDEKGQQALINYCLKNSVIATNIKPSAADSDRMLTLSTCSADGGEKTRWVVHAVLALEIKK